MLLPEIRYAQRGDIHVAYQVLGEGEIDLVFVSEWFFHLEGRPDIPSPTRFFRRLSSFSRFITFDKYGIGLSDPAPAGSLPPLEEWMDDVRAVMDAAGSERAAILGAGEGGIMAAMFAATHPDRTSSLILGNSAARLRSIGVEIRGGLHCGEIERRGPDVSGLAVHIAARVQAEARPGEMLVTRTVKDLVVGAEIPLVDRGLHGLNGIPDEWQLFAVELR